MSSDHGEGADPHRSRPTRSQPPQNGAPPGGTRGQEGEAESPPGEERGSQGAHGSGSTGPVASPTTPEGHGAPPPPPPPTEGSGTPPHGSGGAEHDGLPSNGDSGGGQQQPGAAPDSGQGTPGATPPPGSGPGSGGPPHGYGPPPPGAGSPYDQPPGAMPPPPPTYGVDDSGGTGHTGSAYGAPDPRLAGMPPLGGLGRRLLARIIDGLIVYIPVSLFLTLIGRIDEFADSDNTGTQYAWGIFGILVYLVYEGLMLTRSGQTVGKKLMGIRVGMLENGAVPAGGPGWIRAAVYSLPAIAPCIGTLFWLYNVLSCTWDRPYRQCVHDKAAKTVVVSTEGQRYTP
ncbi:RDD family protein [Streptomyces sp. NBC_01808]|uniref:RDD family protein n=1 Tax=Streptomyces sp. NBC_01808 TaxID=2975947 RepID=UPI002DD7CF16|nr:RDD family protein [Streptomyces sp. NBC_01808]WSA38040.1 RDD family protein [Streptomyces sp. NBC_01808]